MKQSQSLTLHALNLLPYLMSKGKVTLSKTSDDLNLAQPEVKRLVHLLQFSGVPPYGGGDTTDCYLENDIIRLKVARGAPLRPPRLDPLECLSLGIGIRLVSKFLPISYADTERLLEKVSLASGGRSEVPRLFEVVDSEIDVAGIMKRWAKMRDQTDAGYPLPIEADILLPEEGARDLDEVDAPFLKAVEYGLPHGMARIRVTSESLEWVVSFVLKYAGEAVVERPEYIRKAVSEMAQRILQRYHQQDRTPET